MYNPSLGSDGGYNVTNNLTDTQKAAISAAQNKANQAIQNAPSYESIGLNSPTVQQYANTLNQNSLKGYQDLLTQDNDSSTANKENGSSFQAYRQAKLGDLLGRQYNENALNALNVAQQNQASNLSNAANAYGLYQGAGTYDPTSGFDPSAYIGMGRGAYSYPTSSTSSNGLSTIGSSIGAMANLFSK